MNVSGCAEATMAHCEISVCVPVISIKPNKNMSYDKLNLKMFVGDDYSRDVVIVVGFWRCYTTSVSDMNVLCIMTSSCDCLYTLRNLRLRKQIHVLDHMEIHMSWMT